MNEYCLSTEFLTEFELTKKEEAKIKILVLFEEKLKQIYSQDLMGQTSPNLVKLACGQFEVEEVNLPSSYNLQDIAKSHAGDCDYVVLLYASTALLRQNTLLDAVEYATTKGLDYCKLHHGAIFKTKALIDNKIEYMGEANFLDKEDFYTVFDNKSCERAREILRQRILDNLIKKGVKIYNKNTTYIDFDVTIEPGVEVYPNNTIRGNSTICSGACLLGNNIITNSIIGKNSKVVFSFISNAKVADNSSVGPFVKVVDKEKK